MSTTCQPGVRLGPCTGRLPSGAKPSVDTDFGESSVPQWYATAFFPVAGSASTASISPSLGQVAWLVSHTDVQSAMVPGWPGSAGKSMSASMTPEENLPGLISATQLPGFPVVDIVANPPESAATLPSGTCQSFPGQNDDVASHDASCW